jgi:hypothetical protein
MLCQDNAATIGRQFSASSNVTGEIMKVSKSLVFVLALGSLGMIVLNGCGSNSASQQTGYLYDDLVSGIEYTTPTQSGVTGPDGSFKYLPGEKVTFKLGNLTLGKAVDGAGILTLFDLVSPSLNGDGSPAPDVVAMAVLLQTLDSDGDPNNGISIAKATRDALGTVAASTLTSGTDLNDLLKTKAKLNLTLKTNTIAADHLLSSVAAIKGATTLAKQTFSSQNISEVAKYTVDTSAVDVAYGTGKLPLAVGSSLALKSNSGGTMVFYGLTDRGPNADSPAPVTAADGTVYPASKVFPVPSYVPKVVEITVKDGKATVSKAIDLLASATTAMGGLPLPVTQTGSTGEISLNSTLTASPGFSANGIDPEGIAIDADGKLWICDEYGPFIARVNPTTGVLEKKYIPGDATSPLPDILKKRVPNRGMEGITIADGLVYAIVQTPLDSDGDGKGDDDYLTLVELNPSTGEVNLYAVTFDKYVKNTNPNGFKSSKVKVGDLMGLGGGKFLMIEQGANNNDLLVNNIVLIDLAAATKITATDYAGKTSLKGITVSGSAITAATRTLIANLRDFGWLPEKAEGLTKLDAQTIAVINDSDFGIATNATCNVNGVSTTLDPTKLALNLATNTLSTTEVSCDSGAINYSIVSNAEYERRTRLWVIKLSKPIDQF